MKKLLRILFILVLLGLGFLSIIKNPQWTISQKILPMVGLEKLLPNGQAGLTGNTIALANPASVYCEQNSGTLEIVTDLSGGQSGVCHLSDGTVCDERAYFRGECPSTGSVEITGNVVSNETSGDISIFSDPGLSLSFSYPKNRGTLIKDSESYGVMLSNGIAENIFLADYNGTTIPGRGAYRGDAAYAINSSSFISNFCADKTNCTLHTNIHGITYVKYYFEEGIMGSNQTKSIILYYLYNPNSSFRGIILSNERLPNEPEKTRDDIVESIQFN